jgi:hypothetical protein
MLMSRAPEEPSETDTLFDLTQASLTQLPPGEAARWATKLEELRKECGCAVGARFFVATLVIYPAVWYLFLRPEFPSPLYATLVGVALTVLAAALGKMTGLLFARRRLRLALRSLQARICLYAQVSE